MTPSRLTPAVPVLAVLAVTAACGPLVSTSPENVVPPSQPVPPEVRLLSAVEAQGCVLTADNVAAVLLAANLTQAQLAEITPQLAEQGRVQVAGTGAIRVFTERCT